MQFLVKQDFGKAVDGIYKKSFHIKVQQNVCECIVKQVIIMTLTR